MAPVPLYYRCLPALRRTSLGVITGKVTDTPDALNRNHVCAKYEVSNAINQPGIGKSQENLRSQVDGVIKEQFTVQDTVEWRFTEAAMTLPGKDCQVNAQKYPRFSTNVLISFIPMISELTTARRSNASWNLTCWKQLNLADDIYSSWKPKQSALFFRCWKNALKIRNIYMPSPIYCFELKKFSISKFPVENWSSKSFKHLSTIPSRRRHQCVFWSKSIRR